MAKVKNCVSRNLIGMASNNMKDYCLPEGEVDISSPDTGVIVLIILYLIEQEPNISRKKLECYLLLLDRRCFDEKGVTLFNWTLKNGRIRNFKSFIDFMAEKQLIRMKGNNRIEVLEAGVSLGTKFSMLCNIMFWIKGILANWKDKTATAMSAEVLHAKLSQQYLLALEHVHKIIEVHSVDGSF